MVARVSLVRSPFPSVEGTPEIPKLPRETGTPNGQELAAAAIWKACAMGLTTNTRGAIPGLISLLKTGDQIAQTQVVSRKYPVHEGMSLKCPGYELVSRKFTGCEVVSVHVVSLGERGLSSALTLIETELQRYLAHKKLPPPLGPPYGSRYMPPVGSEEKEVFDERGTHVAVVWISGRCHGVALGWTLPPPHPKPQTHQVWGVRAAAGRGGNKLVLVLCLSRASQCTSSTPETPNPPCRRGARA